MLSQLLSSTSLQFVIVLDVGARSSEDNDYRLLGAEPDAKTARQIVKSLNASIHTAYDLQRQFREKQYDLQRRDPDAYGDGYARFEAHQRRRIPNDYGARITYDDVERGARVRFESVRHLKNRVGGKA